MSSASKWIGTSLAGIDLIFAARKHDQCIYGHMVAVLQHVKCAPFEHFEDFGLLD